MARSGQSHFKQSALLFNENVTLKGLMCVEEMLRRSAYLPAYWLNKLLCIQAGLLMMGYGALALA